jgi:hypothetical protein
MRYILILLLFISGAASAQFAPTSAKSKFVNGIAIGSKDTSAFSAADTMVLTIARDSVMYYKYRGVWRPIATGGNLNNYKLISDTLFNNGYTTRARTKQYGDSIAALKLNISDTAAMLANRLKISDTLTMLSKLSLDRVLINGNTSGRGVVLGTGSFTSSGSSSTVEINHLSGSGAALSISKDGNDEGLRVTKLSGSGNAATIIGTLNATTLVKSGGTSSQFLMADGSVNTSVLPSGAYLPLSGGTLTGALNGTTASFSGGVNMATSSGGVGFGTTALTRSTFNFKTTNVAANSNTFNVFVETSDAQGADIGGSIGLGGQVGGDVNAFAVISGRKENSSSGNYAGYFALNVPDGGATMGERLRVSSSLATFSVPINGTSAAFSGGVNLSGAGATAKPDYLRLSNAAAPTFNWDIWRDNTNGHLNFGYAVGGANTTSFSLTTNGNTLIKTTTDNGTDALQVAGSGFISGNTGIGVSPSAWSVVQGFQVLNANISSTGGSSNNSNFGSNFYYDGTNFRYLSSAAATNLKQLNGGFEFYSAASGTAGNTISTFGTPIATISPTGAATFSSTVSATGFIVSSDRRLKNIVSRSGDMVTYTLKADKDKILHYGYIAQEVEKVLPTTVSTDDKGMKAVNYIEVLVKKVNDLEKKIEQLKKHNK